MKKIIVLGSNSFSGAHFVAHALQQGYRVYGCSRSVEPDAVFLPYRWQQANNFTFHQIDINHDLSVFMDVMRQERPEYIVNFLAQGMVAESWQHPEHWFRTNTLSQVMLHDHLRQCDFIKKYVHISTPEVYGSTQGVIQENTHYAPSTPYATSRAAADMSLMNFFHAYNFPVVFTRAANVYGAGQQLYRIIPRTIMDFLTGGILHLHGGGHSVRSFIHIHDVVRATLTVMEEAPAGEIYHIATQEHIAIRDLVAMIAERMQVDFDAHVYIVGERLGKDAAYTLDSQKIRTAFQWSDKISLTEGIDDVLGWCIKNRDILQKQAQKYVHKP